MTEKEKQTNSYDAKRQERLLEERSAERRRLLKKVIKTGAVSLIVAAPVFGFVWLFSRPKVAEGEIVSRNGLHWHAQLVIEAGGKRHDIPAGIGLTGLHSPIHTHDADGIIHMEFSGIVRKDDLRLGKFFDVWGKQFNSQCVLDFCNSQEAAVKMAVGGNDSSEFEAYQMKDGDKIEIKFN